VKIAILFFKLALFTSIASTLGDEQAPPVRIACIGDSITQGGVRDRDEFTYRWPLFCKLVDAGLVFDFIGSLDHGLDFDAKWPPNYKGVPFDPDHEGVYGIKTRQALDRLPAAIQQWPAAPDIALIHLGTNDLGAEDVQAHITEPLRGIVKLLRTQNPQIVILLGHLNFNTDKRALIVREDVERLRAELDTPESPVRTVNHFEDWHEQPSQAESDTFDWVHPNPQGQGKMAAKWLEAMKPYLPN
jgi:lysophospholipase L1-like esterase